MPLQSQETDEIRLMKALARMANMEFARVRKMILVLEIDHIPLLYVESYLSQTGESLEDVSPVVIVTEEVKPGEVEITEHGKIVRHHRHHVPLHQPEMQDDGK